MSHDRPRPYRKIETERFVFDLWRLSHEEYRFFDDRSFIVESKKYSMWDVSLQGKNILFPKLLIALEHAFGRSSDHFDDSRQTFIFAFFMKLYRREQAFPYILTIYDYRGGLNFRFHRVMDNDTYLDINPRNRQEPIEEELPEEDFRYLMVFLWEYLYDYSETICNLKLLTGELKPFFRYLGDNNMIYGFCEGKFFEEYIENNGKYKKRIADLHKICDNPFVFAHHYIDETVAMIESITK
jgi:hypothetical protein